MVEPPVSSRRQVRAKYRRIVDSGGDHEYWGNDVSSQTADTFKTRLVEWLISNGYEAVKYPPPDGLRGEALARFPEAIAYCRNGSRMPRGREPLLIDDGGSVMLRVNGTEVKEYKVLKVAIRDADGENRELHDDVVTMLRGCVQDELQDGAYDHGERRMPEEGTRVYALKRNDEDSRGSGQRTAAVPVGAGEFSHS